MSEDKKAFLEDDLTEADRLVLRVYGQDDEVAPWDESDDKILAMARSIHGSSEDGAESPDNVISFADRRKKFVRNITRSPATGFAIAASLVLGVFTGQGITPYVDLGVAPGYQELSRENAALKNEVVRTRSLRLRRPPKEAPKPTPPPEEAKAPALSELTRLFDELTCADVSLRISSGPGLQIVGFVGSAGDLRRLSSAAAAHAAGFRNISNDVKIFGWPLCEAMQILSTQTIGAATKSGGPTVRTLDHGTAYKDGEDLVLEIIAGPKGGYVYVDFLQHDGTAIHLLPFDKNSDNKLTANQKITIGDGQMRYSLAPPFGTEMISVIQSPRPLFDLLRKEAEPARDYFAALKLALRNARRSGLAEQIFSDQILITTSADGSASSPVKN